jgi:cytoskeletal protein RodZ
MSNRRAAAIVFCVALGFSVSPVSAAPFDFFKKIGNAFAHPRHSPAPAKSARTKSTKRATTSSSPQPSAPPQDQIAATKGSQAGAQAPSATPTPMPETRAASTSVAQPARADLPYGVPVPNRPGFVFSPFSPNGGYVDVRGFPSGTAVKDPYTGKLFLTP